MQPFADLQRQIGAIRAPRLAVGRPDLAVRRISVGVLGLNGLRSRREREFRCRRKRCSCRTPRRGRHHADWPVSGRPSRSASSAGVCGLRPGRGRPPGRCRARGQEHVLGDHTRRGCRRSGPAAPDPLALCQDSGEAHSGESGVIPPQQTSPARNAAPASTPLASIPCCRPGTSCASVVIPAAPRDLAAICMSTGGRTIILLAVAQKHRRRWASGK